MNRLDRLPLFDRSKPKDTWVDLPQNIEMYQVPGQEDIRTKTFNRYLKDRENLEDIKKAIDPRIKEYVNRVLEDQNEEVILEGLQSDNPIIQKIAAAMISETTEPDVMLRLINVGLNHPNTVVQDISAITIPLAPESEKFGLVEGIFEHKGESVQIHCLQILNGVSYELKYAIISNALLRYSLRVPWSD
jgi:hypothetical protein